MPEVVCDIRLVVPVGAIVSIDCCGGRVSPFLRKGPGRLFVRSIIGLPSSRPACIREELPRSCAILTRWRVGFHCQRFLYFDGEISRVGSLAQAQGCQHIAFGRDAQARTASLKRFFADFLPQFHFHLADVLVFGIFRDFFRGSLRPFEFEGSMISSIIRMARRRA